MKYFPYIIITCLLMAIGSLIYTYSAHYKHKQDYTLDIYTDTIYDYFIITTVVNNGNNIGVNSIIADNIYDFNHNN